MNGTTEAESVDHGGMPSDEVEWEPDGPAPNHYVILCEESGCDAVDPYGWPMGEPMELLAVRMTEGAARTVASEHALRTQHTTRVEARFSPVEKRREDPPAFSVDKRTAEAIRSLRAEEAGVRARNGVVIKTPELARFLKYGTPLPAPREPAKPPVHHPPTNPWEGIIENHLKELGLGVPKDKTLSDYKFRRLCFELAQGEPGGGFYRMRTDDGDLLESTGRLRRGEDRLRFFMERTGWTVEATKNGGRNN